MNVPNHTTMSMLTPLRALVAGYFSSTIGYGAHDSITAINVRRLIEDEHYGTMVLPDARSNYRRGEIIIKSAITGPFWTPIEFIGWVTRQ